MFSDDVQRDGICLDPEGGVWVAGRTYGVIRVKDDGQIDEVFNLEQPAFATALGGPRERCLFICTAISDDPVVTRQCPGAHIDAIEV